LAAHTNRAPGAISQKDAFDTPTIGKLQKEFLGPIGSLLMRGGGRPEQIEMTVEQQSQILGQIGHFVESLGPSLIYPSKYLRSSKLGNAPLEKPICKLFDGPVEQVIALGVFRGILNGGIDFDGLLGHQDSFEYEYRFTEYRFTEYKLGANRWGFDLRT
jgi:hypothetical protein